MTDEEDPGGGEELTDEENESATDGSGDRTIDLPAGTDPDDPPVEGERSDGDCIDGWPADLRGVTESVVATLGPNGRWNQALLGLHGDLEAGDDAAVTARTWGRTRTRRNFQERGRGYVQFVRDPLAVTEAALGIYETDDPVLTTADAWVEVEAVEIDRGHADGTEWIDWELSPRRTGVVRKAVPTTDRGFAALFEATVAASRFDVEGYDRATLRDRLRYFETVVETCGDRRQRRAFERIDELTEWRDGSTDATS